MKTTIATLAIVLAGCVARTPTGNKDDFDRFSPDLPRLLETDAVTIMVRGITIDMGSHICNRVSADIASLVAQEVAQWKVRNETFTRGAGHAVNAFASSIEATRGADAKKTYLNDILFTTARESVTRVASQFNGPSPENSLVPSAEACARMAFYLRSGAADVEKNPEITKALRPYMARRGLY